MAASKRITPCSAALPVRVPHLMQFHTRYSGLASVSNYFCIHPTPLPESHPLAYLTSAIVEAQLVSAPTIVAVPEEKENAPTVSVIATATAEIKAEAGLVIQATIFATATSWPHRTALWIRQ